MAKRQSAEQIHHGGQQYFRKGRFHGGEYRDYCRSLYQAIKAELEETGSCPFLEGLYRDLTDLRGKYQQTVALSGVGVAEFLAVRYAYWALTQSDASQVNYYLNNPYVDGDRDVAWDHLPGIQYNYPIASYVNLVDSLRRVAAERFSAARRPEAAPASPAAQSAARTAPDAESAEVRRLTEEAKRKNDEAEEKLQKVTALLERVRDAVGKRDSLEEELRTLCGQNDNARSILDRAGDAAKRITDEAARRAEEVRKNAEDHFESQCDAAQKRAREITAAAEEEARTKAAALVKRYLRTEIAEAPAPRTEFPVEEARQVRLSKDAAVEGAYQMERDLRERLDTFKHEMQEQLNTWRRDLYGQEFGPLADFYQTLYRQLGSGSKTVQTIAAQVDRLAGQEEPSEQDRELLRRLGALQKELAALVEQLGKVMGGLGLEIIRPERGEPFDRELHIDEEAESDSDSAEGVIDTVRFPAVCGRDSAGYLIPIRPAAVTVKASEPEDHDR